MVLWLQLEDTLEGERPLLWSREVWLHPFVPLVGAFFSPQGARLRSSIFIIKNTDSGIFSKMVNTFFPFTSWKSPQNQEDKKKTHKLHCLRNWDMATGNYVLQSWIWRWPAPQDRGRWNLSSRCQQEGNWRHQTQLKMGSGIRLENRRTLESKSLCRIQLDLLLSSATLRGRRRFILWWRPREALNSRTPRVGQERGKALKIEIESVFIYWPGKLQLPFPIQFLDLQ